MLLRLRKSLMQAAWMAWEKGFDWISRFRSSHTTHFGICKVMIKKHRGESIVCADSTIIDKGDWVGELHLNNEVILTLIKSEGPDRAALMTARSIRKSMQQISEAFAIQPEYSEVKALVGITLLHRGLTHGLGFEQQPLKANMFQRITTAYLRLLLSTMHPEGKKRIARKTEQLIPMILIHTRNSLKNRFRTVKSLPVREELRLAK
ncbi:polysaccharide deacetylase [Paenibacillus sp. DXFW5]|uniref:Polysaccharide deacetylase n=1 Tax=Paenibacillus rhizolycopersici TaxID=2780073 RepID=A0ABS2H1Y6_9BACL|nr:polysaccharide deacetylase [Paenibacillus rhizolycopersici]MBM6994726.1 polysaccharide deacetylase [Paenibacillus rhizolycopersici]